MSTEVLEHDNQQAQKDGGPFYIVFVDDVEHRFDHTPVSGREIMDASGILHSVGLILIKEDGTQEQITLDQKIDLKPGQRFKKAPRFKRG
jgi:hypothetical protein